MSIITTWEAVPSRLYSLFASLVDAPSGEDREKFEAISTPPSLRNKSDEEEETTSTVLFSNALREAVAVGLVETADGKLRVTDRARSFTKTSKDKEQAFRRFMVDVLLDESKASAADQSSFMASLAWFLTKSPFKPISFKADPTADLKADLGAKAAQTGLTVIANYQNFLYWARYLGFATMVGGRDSDADRDSRRYIFPDPLDAINAAIPSILGDQNELPIEQFVSRLAAIFPVFEAGAVRQQMIDSSDGTGSGAIGTKLSQATSLALQRMESNQILHLRRDADAPMIILDLGRTERRISHVSRNLAA
jgi:hypothetical protein